MDGAPAAGIQTAGGSPVALQQTRSSPQSQTCTRRSSGPAGDMVSRHQYVALDSLRIAQRAAGSPCTPLVLARRNLHKGGVCGELTTALRPPAASAAPPLAAPA